MFDFYKIIYLQFAHVNRQLAATIVVLPATISNGWASIQLTILFPHRPADLWMVRWMVVSHLGSAFFKRAIVRY